MTNAPFHRISFSLKKVTTNEYFVFNPSSKNLHYFINPAAFFRSYRSSFKQIIIDMHNLLLQFHAKKSFLKKKENWNIRIAIRLWNITKLHFVFH